MCVHLPWDRGTFGPNFIWFKMKVTHLYLFIRKLMKKGNERIRKSNSKRVQFHPKLFQLFSMRWIWMKLSFFNVTLSNVFIRLFFIRFLVSKCKTVMFYLLCYLYHHDFLCRDQFLITLVLAFFILPYKVYIYIYIYNRYYIMGYYILYNI